MPSRRSLSLPVLVAVLVIGAPHSRAQAQTDATLRGRVLVDSTEAPIAGAIVSLPGQQLVATTDSLGRFRIGGITPRRHSVRVRRLGFAPFSTDLSFGASDSVDVDFVLKPVTQSLPEVVVATTITGRKLREFQERRRFGIGHLLDSTDMARGAGSRLSEKVRHLPGLVVGCRGNTCVLSSTRGRQSFLRQGAQCRVAIGLDGVYVSDFNINDVQPSEVAAIEWYAGPAQMPPQFNSTRTTCGFLMIWTR